MGRNSAELVVMYDNKYNISVVASLCGTNGTTFITINQGMANHAINSIIIMLVGTKLMVSQPFYMQ